VTVKAADDGLAEIHRNKAVAGLFPVGGGCLGMLLISHDRALLTCFADEIHTLDAGRVQ